MEREEQHMSNNYYFMNGNKKLLEFHIEATPLGETIEQIKSFSDIRPVGFTDIDTWLDKRNYAKHKEHFKKWLKEWKLDTTIGFIDITHGLGINDCLWVKSVESELTWEKVNLYQNQFTDVAQKTAFEAGLFGLQLSSTSPEFTSEGSAPKCWKNEDGHIYLYKSALSGASNFGLEANAEYIASEIARQIVGDESIPYDLEMFKGKLCSKCELFTNEAVGYVPFYKYIDVHKHYTINDILKICKNIGYEDEFRRMILIDSIVFNQDRHLGNFGFLVDNRTFEIKAFAPLFDYNISMLCNALLQDIDTVETFHKYEDEFQLGHKLGGRFSEVGKAILTPELKELIPRNIEFPYHDKYNLDETRIERLVDIMEEILRDITDLHYYRVGYSEQDEIDFKKE